MLKNKKSKKRGFENMKKFKKVIVALLAMVMVLGCLTVAASAAEDTVKVTVIWEGTEGTVNLYGWEGVDLGGWPGKQMTKVDAKTFTYDITPKGATCNLIADLGDKQPQTVDIKSVATDKGDITITVGAAGDDGKHAATVSYGTNANAGVSAPVAVAAIAVVSMVGIVVFAKRRTVAE